MSWVNTEGVAGVAIGQTARTLARGGRNTSRVICTCLGCRLALVGGSDIDHRARSGWPYQEMPCKWLAILSQQHHTLQAGVPLMPVWVAC